MSFGIKYQAAVHGCNISLFGMNNLFQGSGILQTSQEKDRIARMQAPARFDVAGFGSGLLSSSANASRQNAAYQDQYRTELGGLLTGIADLFV